MAFRAPKPSGGLRGLRGAFGGLWCPRFPPLKPFRVPAGLRGASGRLRGASRRLRGASAACRGLRGPPRASGLRRLVCGGLDVGFGSGFRVFLGLPPYPCLADPEISAPPGRPRTPPRTPLGRFPGRSRTPGPWKGLQEARKPWTAGLSTLDVGFGSGFRVLLGSQPSRP